MSVWSDYVKYPVTVNTIPDGDSDYAKYKLECEKRILEANRGAYIVRLGWQIGNSPDSNNMLRYLYMQMEEKGCISASRSWYPACSFIWDTAAAAYDIVTNNKPGLYLADSNNGLSFYDIAVMLSKKHTGLHVKDDSDFKMDNRMVDDRVKINKLN